jgi:uncharacterized protein (TIGR02391 family)
MMARRLDRRRGALDEGRDVSKLHELFPTAEALLEQTPETLAPTLLRIGAAERQPGGMFWPALVLQVTVGSGMMAENQHAYPFHKQHQVDALVGETWELLRRTGMIHPAPDVNGQNGWMVLSRDGEEAIKMPDGFDRIRALRSFPKELLHPSIAKDAWAALQRGDFSTAVRDAFTLVEIAVREAGGYTNDDYGTELMRKAFHEKNGPLTDPALPKAERESFAHLFAGAIGSFKNPHSHRRVIINDMREAQRQVLEASHLLYIVDRRKAAIATSLAGKP